MKIAVLVNESLDNMALGANSTLAYIVAAIDLDFEVFVCDFAQQDLTKKDGFFGIFLSKENFSDLIEEFKIENSKIIKSHKKCQKYIAKNISALDLKFENRQFSFKEIDFVIQRFEPMKPPFKPFGEIGLNQFLQEFSNSVFTKNNKFNSPFSCCSDKELPKKIDENIAIKTKESFVEDDDLGKKINSFANKIVIKPDNSAQSCGVFAVEFVENGFDKNEILQQDIDNFASKQVYRLKKGLNDSEILEIVQILLFLENQKAKNLVLQRKIQDLSKNEIISGAKSLYDSKILIQDFVEGVEIGDIRINLIKIDQEFKVFGAVLRKSLVNENDDKFTTGLTSGAAMAQKIEDILTFDEQEDLRNKILIVLQKLNGDLKEKYKNCYEIGLDFLILGDKKTVLLNEANHFCQALMPFSEGLYKDAKEDNFYNKINGEQFEYDGGIGFAKKFIESLED